MTSSFKILNHFNVNPSNFCQSWFAGQDGLCPSCLGTKVELQRGQITAHHGESQLKLKKTVIHSLSYGQFTVTNVYFFTCRVRIHISHMIRPFRAPMQILVLGSGWTSFALLTSLLVIQRIRVAQDYYGLDVTWLNPLAVSLSWWRGLGASMILRAMLRGNRFNYQKCLLVDGWAWHKQCNPIWLVLFMYLVSSSMYLSKSTDERETLERSNFM